MRKTNGNILPREFYERDIVRVAKLLLGKLLVHRTPEGVTSGVIVETEAYLPKNDPACHAARGKTKRNSVMFERGGTAYVYFNYGNHYLLNAVAEKEGVPSAVLLRALEPVDGLKLMEKRRKTRDTHNLCSGPGKLCQALSVSGRHNQMDLTSVRQGLYIMDIANTIKRQDINITTRVGIREGSEMPLRFYIRGSVHVSRK